MSRYSLVISTIMKYTEINILDITLEYLDIYPEYPFPSVYIEDLRCV